MNQEKKYQIVIQTNGHVFGIATNEIQIINISE